jgi:hypothetical protein
MTSTPFLDFEVEVRPGGGRRVFEIKVTAPDGAECDGQLRLPGEAQYRPFAERLAALDTTDDTLRQVGAMLFRALFRDQAREQLTASLRKLDEGQSLRLRLNIPAEAAEVAALPWEFLHDPEGDALALTNVSVVRYLPQPTAVRPLAARPPLRVLLTAAPTPPQVDVEREIGQVRAALQRLGAWVTIEEDLNLTRTSLQRKLREDFHIWHFVGHGALGPDGKTAELRLLDESGDVEPVSAAVLAYLLGRSEVRLVVLNACESARLATDPFRSLAPALVRARVPAVIAQQFAVSTESSRIFAEEFYRALAEGRSLDTCVAEGRTAVMSAVTPARPDWGIPVLYTRARDGHLFDTSAPPPPLAAATTGAGQPSAAAPPPAPQRPPDGRALNIWVDGFAADAPLLPGQPYRLMCDVGPARAGAHATIPLDQLLKPLPPDEPVEELLVMVASNDCLIYGGDTLAVRVPPEGAAEPAAFSMELKRSDEGKVSAFLFANNTPLRREKISLRAQAPVPPADGPALAYASAPAQTAQAPAPLLTIARRALGYELTLRHADEELRAVLDLSERQVVALIERAQRTLREIVGARTADGTPVYGRASARVAREHRDAALMSLAETGYYLYQQLFYSFGSSPEARALGERLRRLSQEHALDVRVTDDRFIFPWDLLYDRDPLDMQRPAPDGLWGFKHRIERSLASLAQAPEQQEIAARERLSIAFVYDPAVDQQEGIPVIGPLRDALDAVLGSDVFDVTDTAGLVTLLGDDGAPADLIYLLASTVKSQVRLADGTIALEDLGARLPLKGRALARGPLVFLGSSLGDPDSPQVRDTLVPLLVQRGARAVIGPLTWTPEPFGAEFGGAFVRRLAEGGRTAGDLLLDLRRDMLQEANNVLGLLYTLVGHHALSIRRDRRAARLAIARTPTGFQATLRLEDTEHSAPLAASRAQIDALLARAEQVLRDIAYTQQDGRFPYGERAPIPPQVYAGALTRLAELGYALFQMLFYGPDSPPETRALGDALRRISQQRPLRLRIDAPRFRFPWALLYDREALDLDRIDVEGFWGFRHILEQRLTPDEVEPVIRPSGLLQVATAMCGLPGGQTEGVSPEEQWQAIGTLARVTATDYPTVERFLGVLNAGDGAPQVLYLACDADHARLVLADGALTCDQLVVRAPVHRPPLQNAPLVIMLGKRSGAWDPELAQGLPLHMLARGARGVLACEGEAPPRFASAFGMEFLRRFCAGSEPAGDLLLDLRREELLRRNNVLGLLFTLYGCGETVVARG